MRPLRVRLLEARQRLGLPWEVLERDYHEYGEPFEAEILVYSLEEIVAEKLRAILQRVERLDQRGWSRSRARDYYDLWRVLGAFKDQMELAHFRPFLTAKCAVRGVAFAGAEDFFQDRMLNYVARTWAQWLGPLVPNLPGFEEVIGALRPEIAELLSSAR